MIIKAQKRIIATSSHNRSIDSVRAWEAHQIGFFGLHVSGCATHAFAA